jgi:hypothetical protein
MVDMLDGMMASKPLNTQLKLFDNGRLLISLVGDEQPRGSSYAMP